ncbi:ribbon-helix-helix domain-containing protein [Hyphomicrobiales bacterium]|jgi:predicted DNA-binding ribbon-helix-helix protein|nr:ribbon-helix-helix domain-containing protein [Rhodobiaceae bacterium]MBT5640056.1 ribbon-helix-helix domain-containing protein [Rhodobiaceae bacterium]MBT6222843.1 ribbon-helix-helix domain-containing protein [Rhodobiaceae bacterium]MDB4832064.1 ribbon-helix-helix domain-containing protein [Hyphomicrobiales bacterium]MDC0139190.1 ribbon-helix-helix domain-containing protein [Hyphomicrobiales bacterium]|tara:strand:+ start:127 stop:330 length:204 start_codon:yes stop_codon:yes gene_type:complete
MIKKSVVIYKHKTSIALEDEFWEALKKIAIQDEISLSKLIERVDKLRTVKNLSSALRVYIIHYYKII